MTDRQHTNAEQNTPISDRLSAIRARLDAATPGPWEWREWSCGDEAITGPDNTGFVVNVDEATPHADADLIAHAPADIAWLLGEVDRLSFQEKNMKRIQKDLQDRHQILASERKKNYSMDVRMVNDGREF